MAFLYSFDIFLLIHLSFITLLCHVWPDSMRCALFLLPYLDSTPQMLPCILIKYVLTFRMEQCHPEKWSKLIPMFYWTFSFFLADMLEICWGQWHKLCHKLMLFRIFSLKSWVCKQGRVIQNCYFYLFHVLISARNIRSCWHKFLIFSLFYVVHFLAEQV